MIPGDGVGAEVIPCAVEALRAVAPDLETTPADAGWDCFTRVGIAFPEATRAAIAACGAALFGATSSPSRKVEGYRSPILQMRQAFDLYANLRPTRDTGLRIAGSGVGADLPPGASRADLLIVRENTEGLYVQREYIRGDEAIAERVITRAASARIGRVALEHARQRSKRLTIVHKANILPLTDGTFRDAVRAEAAAFPDVQVNELLVDSAALQIGARPQQFDVIVTTNLFGDILSDLASMWGGGMGVAPALNLGAGIAIAEPVHGSAPDIAGKGIANPAGAILSAALLLRHHWARPAAADQLEAAVFAALAAGARTPDLGGTASTRSVTDAVLALLS
ncbi:MAG: isocitrate/isopropylmalate family dehydrogenase [Thermoflexales bacterium]